MSARWCDLRQLFGRSGFRGWRCFPGRHGRMFALYMLCKVRQSKDEFDRLTTNGRLGTSGADADLDDPEAVELSEELQTHLVDPLAVEVKAVPLEVGVEA